MLHCLGRRQLVINSGPVLTTSIMFSFSVRLVLSKGSDPYTVHGCGRSVLFLAFTRYTDVASHLSFGLRSTLVLVLVYHFRGAHFLSFEDRFAFAMKWQPNVWSSLQRETQLFDFGYVRLNISCPVAMQLRRLELLSC
jgi:hypothetical protein